MNEIQILGLLAGSLTTAAFLPQVIKNLEEQVGERSFFGYVFAFCLGVAMWLVYGFVINHVPVIAANFVTLLLASTLLFFKIRYKQ